MGLPAVAAETGRFIDSDDVPGKIIIHEPENLPPVEILPVIEERRIISKDHLLAEGHTINAEGLAGREIYIIRGPDGQPTGVRKFGYKMGDRPFYLNNTRHEAQMYQQIIRENPDDWHNHLIPYRHSYNHPSSIIIDFDWVDGENIQTYLESHPEKAIEMFTMIVDQLTWLAEKGYTHGDIKLDNFFRTVDGRVLILDLAFLKKDISFFPARKEKGEFIGMIRTYVSKGLVRDLDVLEPIPLTEFYTNVKKLLTSPRRGSSGNGPLVFPGLLEYLYDNQQKAFNKKLVPLYMPVEGRPSKNRSGGRGSSRSSKNRSGGKSSSSRRSSKSSSGGRRSSSKNRPRGGAGGA